jgi:hypothetical protein
MAARQPAVILVRSSRSHWETTADNRYQPRALVSNSVAAQRRTTFAFLVDVPAVDASTFAGESG